MYAGCAMKDISGKYGHDMYMQWASRRKNLGMRRCCLTTGGYTNNYLRLRQQTWMVHMCKLKYPQISPVFDSDWEEFDQRCWWLGISTLQGMNLRFYNMAHRQLPWP